jgi:hypothetical protein
MKYNINRKLSNIEALHQLVPGFKLSRHLSLRELIVLDGGSRLAIVGTNIPSYGYSKEINHNKYNPTYSKATIIVLNINRVPTHTFSVDLRGTSLEDVKVKYLSQFGYEHISTNKSFIGEMLTVLAKGLSLKF